MKWSNIFVIVLVSLSMYQGITFGFQGDVGLDAELDTVVNRIEEVIDRKGENMRYGFLWVLKDMKKNMTDNPRSNYIVDYVLEEIDKRTLTIEDFPDTYENIKIEQLPRQIIATVINEGTLGQRNDDAFDYLAGFIFGDNTTRNSIAMTSPVTREKITDTMYETAFIMPKKRTLENLPQPNNDRVKIKEIPGSLQAVWRFSGYVNEADVALQREQFQTALTSNGISWYGMPTLAQYDGPWVAPRARTNELRVSLNPK